MNVSVIPHCRTDLTRLQHIITPAWVTHVVKHLRNAHDSHTHTVDVFEVPGVAALNIVVKDVLDGGVSCSRRLDRHGKSLSDLILSQLVSLPEDSKLENLSNLRHSFE